MKKWIPVAMVIGLVLAIPLVAVSHEGAHEKGEQHQSGKMFEEGSGTSVVEPSSDHMKAGDSDRKMGSEYVEEGSTGIKKHKEGKEYSDKSMHKNGEMNRHKEMKSHRKKEGS